MKWIHCLIARTPVPPHERVADIPDPLSHIVTKLLAKTAEERYQTTAGVERDLRRCLAEWQAKGRIDAFSVGETDTADRLLIPEKLYGRDREIAGLLSTYERVATTGTPELMLISGYSGIGKSSVVNELHKALLASSGFFASGKFDQHKRDIPYTTVAQAFQGMIRSFLSKSDAELEAWRSALREALGAHGGLVVGLMPELKLIIGEQPPAPDLPPQQARRLFQVALRRFIGVFAAQEHPLALFLDDFHWVDAATLDLLEDLMIRSDQCHLLVIAAYRDNEVDATHPLVRKLEAIRVTGANIKHITLMPLCRENLEELIADALRCARALFVPLAQLVHEKTGGNPFFAIQFLYALADEGSSRSTRPRRVVDLVERLEGSYRFMHDRVQEVAYSLIPQERRAETHLRVGQLLLTHTPSAQREETIFDIVNQLNRGAGSTFFKEQRQQLAELNLIAGKRARASTGFRASVLLVGSAAGVHRAQAGLPEPSGNTLAFTLMRCGFSIGTHAMTFSRDGDLLTTARCRCR